MSQGSSVIRIINLATGEADEIPRDHEVYNMIFEGNVVVYSPTASATIINACFLEEE
ncbi:MAG: hypothetical protein ABII71_04320 [Candidatus Micrarchaeota archaeon]